LGTLTPAEYAPIQAGLRQMFDLPEGAAGPEGTEGEPALSDQQSAISPESGI
jgi:hypothetical protein